MSRKAAGTTTGRGRHRRETRRTVLVAILTSSAVAAAAAGILAATRTDETAAAACPATPQLRVSAAPEVTPAVRHVTRTDPSLRCLDITVTADEPATAARAFSRGSSLADVWIPDSTVWLSALRPGAIRRAPPSIASSPVVLAVPTGSVGGSGDAPTIRELGRAAVTAEPVRLRLPRIAGSAVAQAALLDLGRT